MGAPARKHSDLIACNTHADLVSGIHSAKRSSHPQNVARRKRRKPGGGTRIGSTKSSAEQEAHTRQGTSASLEMPTEGRRTLRKGAWGCLVFESSGEQCDKQLRSGLHGRLKHRTRVKDTKVAIDLGKWTTWRMPTSPAQHLVERQPTAQTYKKRVWSSTAVV